MISLQELVRSKKAWVIGGLVLVIAVLASMLYFPKGQYFDSRRFVGKFINISGNVITAQGVFTVNSQVDPIPDQKEKIVSITVNKDTRYFRSIMFPPSREELLKTGGYFHTDNIQKEEKFQNFDDFKKEMESRELTIEVETDHNIFGKSSFEAKLITYRYFSSRED